MWQVLATVIGVVTTYRLIKEYIKYWKSPLHAIPAVGYTGFFTSYITAFQFFFYAPDLLQEGYRKYPGRVFRVSTISKWFVIATTPQQVDDLRRAKDDQLSAHTAIDEVVSVDLLLGPQILKHDYHSDIIRTQVTRNLTVIYPDIKDEISTVFSELIPTDNLQEWTEFVAYPVLLQSVVRVTNRLLVGLPLCRNKEYNDLQTNFTVDLFKASSILHLFPRSIRPFVARFINVESKIKRIIKLFTPMIEDRFAKIDEYGEVYPDKPHDVISWCLDYAKGVQRTVREVTLRIMVLNTGAIHTTTLAFTHALYDLAIHPEYVSAMREEVDSVVAEYGWTKEAVDRMHKVDSFLKESMRFNIPGALSVMRKVMTDFTFSSGEYIPAGSAYVFAGAYTLHNDEDIYPGANEFDGFRFVGMSDKFKMVSLQLDYLAFGHGRNACPGRFFAATELKTMMAVLLMNYDVKLPGNKRPKNYWFEDKQLPSLNAKVLFRKRR